MTILDDLLSNLLDGRVGDFETPSLVEPWVDEAIQEGALLVAKLPTALQPFAQTALDRLAANKGVLGTVSQKAFVGLVSKLALGQGEQAARVYLGTAASFDERIETLEKDSEATRQEVADRNAAWEKVKSIGEGVLSDLGHAAVPFLLGIL